MIDVHVYEKMKFDMNPVLKTATMYFSLRNAKRLVSLDLINKLARKNGTGN